MAGIQNTKHNLLIKDHVYLQIYDKVCNAISIFVQKQDIGGCRCDNNAVAMLPDTCNTKTQKVI